MIEAAQDPRSLRRREDERFLRGMGRYVEDGTKQGDLHAVILRAPHAHAAIGAIDTGHAAAMPGVRGVFTAADLERDGLACLPCSMDLRTPRPLIVPPRYPLARGRVRHVGEPVALIVAGSQAAAQDAAEAVLVEYDTLPATIDPVRARDAGAPQLWDQAPGNVAFHYQRGDAVRTAAAIASAPHVVTLDLVNNRIAAAALETRTAVAWWDGRYRLELSGASVHVLRRELAVVLGIPESQLDVVCPDVGGGFGMKNVTYPEYALLLWAARRLSAPVRWTASRLDEFTSGVHGRANVTKASLALDTDGTFLALQVETTADLGAYLSTGGPGSSTIAPTTAMGGLYAIPAISMDVHGVFTNTVPIDAYRGAGKPEANYIIERLIDVAGRRLGRDALALRRRNLIRTLPYTNATGFTIECGEFHANLERALSLAGHTGFAERREDSAARGKLRGLGIACFLETSRGPINEEGWLRFRTDGGIDLAVGTQSNGQGHETSFPQLLAAKLGLPPETFHLVQGDTRTVPRGGGHGGARSLHMGGTALLLAAEDTLRRARPAAARMLQTEPESLTFRGGAFHAADGTGLSPAITLLDLAEAARDSDTPNALDGHGNNLCDTFTFPNGCHVAEVEIDPETGAVTLASYVAVDDYGTLLNPLLTEGQVQGGIAQGIGQALTEGICYDADTGQLISASFADYAIPRGGDLPDIALRFVEIPTLANPIGSKGSGQAGAIGAPQTVMNAVADALRPLGIEHIDMPATPMRVWTAIHRARHG